MNTSTSKVSLKATMIIHGDDSDSKIDATNKKSKGVDGNDE